MQHAGSEKDAGLDDGRVFQDDSPAAPPSPAGADEMPAEEALHRAPATGWSHPPYRYLWAVATYSKRLNFVSSLVLSHASSSHNIAHSSSLHRLLKHTLEPQASPAMREQYTIATHTLLNLLSQGTAADAEDRFAYLLEAFPYEDDPQLAHDGDKRSRQDEDEFWACQGLINEGMAGLLDGIASVLCTMMAIFFQTGMVDRLCDVFGLMRSICIHQSSMVHSILSPSSLVTEMGEAVSATPPFALEMELDRIMVGCIRRVCSGNTEAAVGEALLERILGLVDIMAYELQENDTLS